MPASPSTRLGLIGPDGADTVATGDDTIRAIIAQLEAVGAAYKVGTAAARVGSDATIQALFYVATDTGVVSVATGSVWLDINPKDAAASTASLRTLGTGSQQAAAGDHNHDTAYQALDSDLTAIAALTTQSYGRSLLTQSSAAAARTALAISDAHPFLGDGSDGAATLDGTATVAWATKSGSVYTATRDFYCTDLTVNAGVTLITAGWRGLCTGTLTNNGTIHNDGTSGGSGGAGALAGYFAGGGNGGTGVAQGVTGTGGNGSAVSLSIGGAGGNASGYQTGGSAGSTTAPTAAQGGLPRVAEAFFRGRHAPSGSSPLAFGGGSGGGGAGGNSSSTQAAWSGGGGGGIVALFCKVLNNQGTISAKGGGGGHGSSFTGGSGPGGGGAVGVFYKTLTNLGTVQASAGSTGLIGDPHQPSSATSGLVITGAI